MSVRLKRAAKALRARLGVAKGVQEAGPDDVCTVRVTREDQFTLVNRADHGEIICGKKAHVVGFCEDHWAAENRPRRR